MTKIRNPIQIINKELIFTNKRLKTKMKTFWKFDKRYLQKNKKILAIHV